MNKVELLLIDPQWDFVSPQGALSVPGAMADMDRIATMITRLGSRLDDIHVTLDQHHLMDVAHPAFWRGSDGRNPSPFTIITLEDIKEGRWMPVIPSFTRRMMEYVAELEKGGRYPLCIWPPHCLIGSHGAHVCAPVFEALQSWCFANKATVDFVSKGSNIFTEHYSAVQAEVPDAMDPSTQLNTQLISTLERADMVLIAGEAGSHCVANTVKDVVNSFSSVDVVKKLTLLTDGMSAVPGFEKNQDDFIREMVALGMNVSTTVDVLK